MHILCVDPTQFSRIGSHYVDLTLRWNGQALAMYARATFACGLSHLSWHTHTWTHLVHRHTRSRTHPLCDRARICTGALSLVRVVRTRLRAWACTSTHSCTHSCTHGARTARMPPMLAHAHGHTHLQMSRAPTRPRVHACARSYALALAHVQRSGEIDQLQS